jgi:hypothetical protein
LKGFSKYLLLTTVAVSSFTFAQLTISDANAAPDEYSASISWNPLDWFFPPHNLPPVEVPWPRLCEGGVGNNIPCPPKNWRGTREDWINHYCNIIAPEIDDQMACLLSSGRKSENISWDGSR